MTRVLVNSNGKAFTTSNNRVLSSSGITPSGSISITENDTYDVTNYANAVVNVSGGGSSPVIETLNVTPSTSAQTITAGSGVDGYSPVNVSAVTSSIDANIQAGNIRAGVTILNITGEYTGESMIETPYEIIDGEISVASGANGFSFVLPSEVTRIAPNTFDNAFADWGKITSVDLSSLEEVDDYGLNCAFKGNLITSVSLPNLRIVGEYGLASAFSENYDQDTGFGTIQSVDLSSLEEVGEYGLAGVFAVGSVGFITSVSLPNLRIIGRGGLEGICSCEQITTISFPSLVTIGPYGLNSAFENNIDPDTEQTTLQTVYFPALTSTSFEPGDESAFDYMLSGDDGVTVHFPSSLQTRIGNWQSVIDGFNGTNITILFDLIPTPPLG